EHVQHGDRLAVALLKDMSVNVGERVVDREDVDRRAVELQEADLTGLAVAGAIEAVEDAEGVAVVELVTQARDDTDAVGLRLAGRQEADGVENIAVTVEIAAEVRRARDITRLERNA